MRKVLISIGCYVPGYKAGGPVRTIANLVERLGDEFDFYIVTADRDMGDASAYPGIIAREWQRVGKAQVMYLPPNLMTVSVLRQLLAEQKYDVLYLNSFFAKLTRYVVLLRRLGALPVTPVLVAPRGEFSPGALTLKALRKNLYLWVTRRLGFYSGLIWLASSALEKRDVLVAMGNSIRDPGVIRIAPNLSNSKSDVTSRRRNLAKSKGTARVVFLSRVSRKKNLDWALRCLKSVETSIEFDIYGPLEDQAYWDECQTLIRQMPGNVRVTYKGVLTPTSVVPTLATYHLFFLPTRGENYGHVIVEAFIAGCPVLISDQTPWRDLKSKHAGWDVSLDQPELFRSVLNQLAQMDKDQFAEWSAGARMYGVAITDDPAAIQTNRQLFLELA